MSNSAYSAFIAKVMRVKKRDKNNKNNELRLRSTAHGFELDARSLEKAQNLESQLDVLDELEAAS
ncbi:hypothetical protein [Pleionea mediterranea]|uniref:Uncharacterized protein n=1 Tax=Pleionea mediterranea TaxID=523701 RepID=A0A316FBR8_9GAMM|nr:hypothetical protein [Pleionea mediterranea]PWK46318.1 hypothetical protein C8D97_1131 [Pleionea mediterranea]